MRAADSANASAEISPQELAAQWRRLILSGACKQIAGKKEFRAIYFCHWTAKNVEVPVVYDSYFDEIVTVLPRASVQVVA